MAESSRKSRKTTTKRSRLQGQLALALWAAAIAVSAADAILAFDRIKILIFTAGLVMMDLAAAIVISIMWFVSRQYIQPQAENKAENDYCYRAGYRDATVRFLRPGPGLHIVRPAMPTPQHIPSQQPRGYFAAESAERAGGQLG